MAHYPTLLALTCCYFCFVSADSTATGQRCFSPSDCANLNAICHNEQCICPFGHRFDPRRGSCYTVTCRNFTDCHIDWPHSVCCSLYHVCVCNHLFEIANDKLGCSPNWSQVSIIVSASLLLAFLLCGLSCYLISCYCRKSTKPTCLQT